MALKKMGSLKNLKKSLEGGGGNFHKDVWFIPKDKTITVRFLEEPDEWGSYTQVYDQVSRKSWPQPDSEDAPGYTTGDGLSTKYLANAVLLDDGAGNTPDKVVVLQLPKSLVSALAQRYEKYGTLTDRDFDLYRTGEGKNDTTYGYDPGDKTKRPLTKYDTFDLDTIHKELYDMVWGDEGSLSHPDDDEGGSARKTTKPAAKKAVGATKKAAAAPEPDEDDGEALPDFEALGESADGGDEDDQDTLAMWAHENDLDPDDYPTWAELAEALLEKANEADPEEDPEEEDDVPARPTKRPSKKPATRQAEPEPPSTTELGEEADGGDEDAVAALTELAEAAGLDPDDYPTWGELAEAIEAEGGETVEMTAEELAAKPIGEVRAYAEANGIETKGKTKKALVDELFPEE